eukprot:gnl/TRDRNA2_/TRDRNA2_190064_c0_seq1.p1 gnl/TRDRNA2_/TRDRNA2_190064_c0~~gnl/TRDRNA2_/TRDRNA2_190064_c0_seq1.p1  ORF type:complete len:341 (+),score=13.30 gnl/TRDRNA2_/TRDRNA2_190064_c0_seq1:73-1095(+)
MPFSLRNDSPPNMALTALCNCMCCCWLTFGTATLLGSFIFVVHRGSQAAPALCQEGKLADPHAGHPRVAIDVPNVDGVSHIECLMPISIYDHGDSDQPPRDNLRQLGVKGPMSIPYEHAQSGVECIPRNASIFADINNVIGLNFIKKCDDEWDCNHGKCNAFEKALRVCLSRVVPDLYKCQYVQGEPEWGVTTKEKQAGQVTSIVLNFVFLVCLAVLFIIYDDEEAPCNVKFDKWRAGLASLMLVSGATTAYLHSVGLQSSLPPPVLQTASDLTEPCTTGQFHMCAAPLHEEAPWNRTMSPLHWYGLHIILLLMFVLLPLYAWWKLTRRSSNFSERTPLV